MHKAVGSSIVPEFEEKILLKILNAFHLRQNFYCTKNFKATVSIKFSTPLWLSTKLRQVTCYIYIYAFSRRFYPKRLTVHSGYTFVLSVFVLLLYPFTTNMLQVLFSNFSTHFHCTNVHISCNNTH